MSSRTHGLMSPVILLAILALAVSACAAPTAAPATVTAPPPTVTVAPPTATAPPATETAAPATATTVRTAAATAVESTATPAPTHVQAATADAGVLATKVQLNHPWGMAFDAGGQLYVSTCPDNPTNPIFQIDPSGLLKTYAGPTIGFGGDGGPALKAQFFCTGGLAFDHDGNLYIADQGNNRIRRIDKDGTVSTVAGSGPGADALSGFPAAGHFSGDGGPATSAELSGRVPAIAHKYAKTASGRMLAV